MIGFFKAAFKRSSGSGTGSGLGSPGAKPSMKVTPRGKTVRHRTFYKDESGNEHGNRILVQDEDDNWYSEERNSKTGEVGYREYKIAGAGTDTKYNSITGRKEPVAEYDSKKQRIASDLAKYNQTLRQEGGNIDRLSGDPFHHAGTKNAKVFGNIQYLPPVDPRNKKTIERETREESYRKSAAKVGEYMGESPKPTGTEAWDYYTGRDSKAKNIYGEYTVKPKAPSGAKSTFEDIDALVEAHRVKPKAKPFIGADTSGAWAKYAESFKPAGTESAGSTRKPYDDKATDDFFGKLYSATRKPSAKPPVIPVAESVTEPVTEPETPPPARSSGKSTKKGSKKGGRQKKSSS